MLFFGHVGITAGAARACDILVSMNKSGGSSPFHHLLSGIKSRIGPIDYRMVLIGSLLPDIIDKPVWFLGARFAGDTALSGRDFAHTLLFNLVLFIAGLVLVSYKKSWLLIISLSSFMHLVLDQIWNVPEVVLWPLLGSLPKEETAGWVPDMFQALFLYPEVYVPEMIGLVIVLFFAYRLVFRKNVTNFIREGAIG